MINQETIDHVKRWEGLRLEAYPDPGSKDGNPWTIGYGHTSDKNLAVKKGVTITAKTAEDLLKLDLEEVGEAIRKLVKVPLSDNQFGALTSFVFNVGIGAFKNSTLLKLLNAGDYSAVPEQLARFKYNDGKVMEGLVNRRAAEAGLWAKGAPVASNTVNVDKPTTNWLTPENIGIASGAGVSIITAASTSGALQMVLAGVIAGGFLIGAFFFVKNKLGK